MKPVRARQGVGLDILYHWFCTNPTDASGRSWMCPGPLTQPLETPLKTERGTNIFTPKETPFAIVKMTIVKCSYYCGIKNKWGFITITYPGSDCHTMSDIRTSSSWRFIGIYSLLFGSLWSFDRVMRRRSWTIPTNKTSNHACKRSALVDLTRQRIPFHGHSSVVFWA